MVAACPFPGNRGTPSRILRMAEGMSKIGYEVHIVTYHFGTDTKTNGINIHRIPKLIGYQKHSPGPSIAKLAFLDPLLFLKLLEIINKYKIKLIHAHHFEGAIISYPIKLSKNIRVIYDAHTTLGGELSSYNFWNPSIIKRELDRTVPKFADHIVTVSLELKDILIKNGIKKNNISYIPTGINPEVFAGDEKQDIKKKYHLSKDLILAYTGTLANYQGIDFLFEAIRTLKIINPNFQMLIVGGGEIEKLKIICNRLNISDKIIFTGDIPFDEVVDVLKVSDIAVITRHNCPGIPQKLTNYMAAGKAIVCFEGSGKILTNNINGMIVKNKDTIAFAETIDTLIKDKELRIRLGKNAKELAIKEYSWDELCKKLSYIYQKL